MTPGIWQIAIVLVLVLILFGAGKLPRVMGDFGKGVRNMRNALKDDAEQDAGSEQRPS